MGLDMERQRIDDEGALKNQSIWLYGAASTYDPAQHSYRSIDRPISLAQPEIYLKLSRRTTAEPFTQHLPVRHVAC